jgi:hypothetical protein
MKDKVILTIEIILTLAFIIFFMSDSNAQPTLPGNDGGSNVTDSPIHFLIPLAMAIGAYLGIKKLRKQD